MSFKAPLINLCDNTKEAAGQSWRPKLQHSAQLEGEALQDFGNSSSAMDHSASSTQQSSSRFGYRENSKHPGSRVWICRAGTALIVVPARCQASLCPAELQLSSERDGCEGIRSHREFPLSTSCP